MTTWMSTRPFASPPRMTNAELSRFEDKYVIDPNSGCWLWTGTLLPGGYGVARAAKRSWPAHRLSYAHHVGPITGRLLVCHRCDVRACVNPAHLFLGDYQANTRDAVRKGRWHKKLTPAQTREIRDAVLSGEHPIDVACRYRISEGHVRKIARGECWQVNA